MLPDERLVELMFNIPLDEHLVESSLTMCLNERILETSFKMLPVLDQLSRFKMLSDERLKNNIGDGFKMLSLSALLRPSRCFFAGRIIKCTA